MLSSEHRRAVRRDGEQQNLEQYQAEVAPAHLDGDAQVHESSRARVIRGDRRTAHVVIGWQHQLRGCEAKNVYQHRAHNN